MSQAALAARLIDALAALANETAGKTAPLISANVEFFGVDAAARVEAKLARATRTLMFLTAEAFDADGARVASAASVHRLAPD